DHARPPWQTRVSAIMATVFRRQLLIQSLLLLGMLLGARHARAYDVLCRDGNSAFQTHFAGIAADVGPPLNGGLAGRSCRAILSWDDEELVGARGVAEIDLDRFAADLGLGHPVAAFQIKNKAI